MLTSVVYYCFQAFYLYLLEILTQLIQIVALCLQPHDVVVTHCVNSTASKTLLMKLSWKKSLGDGLPQPTDHQIETRAAGEEEWTMCGWDNSYARITSMGSCIATVEDLPDNVEHQFRVAGIYPAGKGSASQPSAYCGEDSFRKCKLIVMDYGVILTGKVILIINLVESIK